MSPYTLHLTDDWYWISNCFLFDVFVNNESLNFLNMFLRANLFGKVFLGHIFFVGEEFLWSKTFYSDKLLPGRLESIKLKEMLGLVLWHNRLGHNLQCLHPLWV